MTRISLKEAYDNRDVIAQLVSLRDDVDELLNILKDIDPDGDLTNVVTKTGDQTIDGVKTFIGKIVADCDIIQNGAAYETHAEQVYTTKDYIVTRDGALGGLQPGEFSGFRVNKYDSVHDGHLVMDMNGVARVGDVNDEQPLTTRDEAASMTSGALVKWDGVNQKIIAPASNVGSDVKPVKIVGGAPVQVSSELVPKNNFTPQDVTSQFTINPNLTGTIGITRSYDSITYFFQNVSWTGGNISAQQLVTKTDGQLNQRAACIPVIDWTDGSSKGLLASAATGLTFWISNFTNLWFSITVPCDPA